MLGRESIDTDNRPTENYDRRLTAYNEAGHAVAAMMRGGTFVSITIEPDGDRDGCTSVEVDTYDMAFVAFAGVWAEARAHWAKPLDGKATARHSTTTLGARSSAMPTATSATTCGLPSPAPPCSARIHG